jgi:glucose-1-phosphate thymidylyltransferase
MQGHFLELLGSGTDFGARFTYEIQDEAGGIAQALSLVKGFCR